jgi:hypothetical protein
MPPSLQKSVHNKLKGWCTTTFYGSGDPEVEDAVDIVDWLSTIYGQQQDELTTSFQAVRARLEIMYPQWVYSRPPTSDRVPVLAVSGESVSCRLPPWKLGFTEKSSKKGKSKMVKIMDTITNMLDRPYDSVQNPIIVDFQAPAQAAIEDYSVNHGIGFAKSLSAKALLLATINTQLTDEELEVVAPNLKALFSMQCTYQSTGDEKKDAFDALRQKMMEANRPRPDVIQISNLFLHQARVKIAQRCAPTLSRMCALNRAGLDVAAWM